MVYYTPKWFTLDFLCAPSVVRGKTVNHKDDRHRVSDALTFLHGTKIAYVGQNKEYYEGIDWVVYIAISYDEECILLLACHLDRSDTRNHPFLLDEVSLRRGQLHKLNFKDYLSPEQCKTFLQYCPIVSMFLLQKGMTDDESDR